MAGLLLSLLIAGMIWPLAAGETAPADSAAQAEAEDISRDCLFNGQSGKRHKLTDGTYARSYQTKLRNYSCGLRITAPEGRVVGAIYIQWATMPLPLNIQVPDESGAWVTVADCDGDFFAQYIPIPALSDFRIECRDNPKTPLHIREIKVLTPGTPPDTVQLWQKPGDKVDMMLIAGHPDDEILWFGGLLPYYGGELHKNILVITASMNWSVRRLELLDCLWACGVRTHPIHCMLEDFNTTDMDQVLQRWGGKDAMLELFTGYFRRYRPDVVMLHDVHGEYGHGIHRTVSWLGRECAALAADPAAFPDQAAQYGTWDIPKIYIHLYPENTLRMDWNRPLSAFGGKTAQEVATEALSFHKTQTDRGWIMPEDAELDNALFGLYRSLVGPDLLKNDFFENIP